ncbi:MAG TPA: ATP-binding protein [Candidatus Sericytochromatia bacterium]
MNEHFYRMDASSNTPCGMSLRNGDRSFIDFNVPQSEDPDGSMQMHVKAGYLCGQSTPLITRSGKLIGMVSTHWHEQHPSCERELRFLDLLVRQATDLIEQRQTANEREHLLAREQAARAEADRANRIKDEFLAVLSHELRSPLNPILGWSKLLQNGKLDAAKTQQALQTIERNAKLQAELIEDLLDVSRILQGKLNLNVSAINLSSIIRAAMETVRLAAEAKAIHLNANLAETGLVAGDATRLQQVMWNLLSNAVKFTPTGGQVNIRLERLDSFAQITISDTGQGIEPDFLPYVFDYFRQADATTTRKFGGLGLGLAIVRHLVELHGGAVAVESPGIGRGAAFTVRLPLMPIQAITDHDSRSSASASDLNGIRVLVVDDEPDSREFVAFVLEQSGAEVVTATTASEALGLLQRLKPDVLLSDIGMPEMDGYMLMQQVRALPVEQGGQVLAIALTAYAGDFNQQQARQAGFQRHLAKPVEPEKLIKTITSFTTTHLSLMKGNGSG